MKAFIFDLNGTMIDDMDCHTQGWLYVLNVLLGGLYTYEQVKREMYGKNSEVLKRFFGDGYFSEAELERLSDLKEKRYRMEFAPRLALLPGLHVFLEKARNCRIKMAIASAAIPANIDFVLDGLNIRGYFDAIVSANDVNESKPHPETFLKAAVALGAQPKDCLVFEDAPKGAEAAQKAGMPAIILTTTHEAGEFADFRVLAFWKNYLNYDERIFEH